MSQQPDSTSPPTNPPRRTFLNVGSGPKATPFLPPWLEGPDWIETRLDIDPNLQPDIVASATEMRMVPDRSFDALWAANIVEHLFAHEVPLALREFARVIKPDGLVQVYVPNLKLAAELIVAGKLEDVACMSDAGPIAPIDIVFGFRRAIAEGRVHMAHKTGFIGPTLERALRSAGFADAIVYFVDWDLLGLASHVDLQTVWMPPFLRELCDRDRAHQAAKAAERA